MNSKLKRLSVFAIFALFSCFAAPGFAQETKDGKLAEPSFEVVLQVLSASNANDAGQPLPAALAAVAGKLKTTYAFTDYRLTATYLNRVESGGNIESRSVSQEPGASAATPTFQNWALYGVKRIGDAGGRNLVQIGNFSFGSRIPVQTGQTFNYDDAGLKINRLNLAENTPTVIGTMNGSKTGELIVLVLTVRPSSN